MKKKVAILTDYVGESLNSTPNVRMKTLCDNYDVDFFIRYKVENLEGLNANSFNNYNLFKLIKMSLTNKYDVIYASPIHHYPLAWIASKISKGVLVLDIFDDITLSKALIKTQKGILAKFKSLIYGVVYNIGKIVIKKADLVFLTLNKEILKHYPSRSKGYKHLTNGIWSSIVNENRLEISKYREDCNDNFEILYVGYVREDRGIFKMLDASKTLLSKGYKKIKFHIAGPIFEDDRDLINSFIKSNKLDDHVILYDFVKYDTVKDLMRKSDLAIYFFPTGRRELDYIYPIKIFEYLSMGVPIISTGGYGILDIREDFKEQILISEYNSNQLADMIIQQYEDRKTKRISNNIEKYYWEKISKEFIMEIENTL